MTRVLNEKLMVFINNDGCFKRFFGIELAIQKAKHFRIFLDGTDSFDYSRPALYKYTKSADTLYLWQ